MGLGVGVTVAANASVAVGVTAGAFVEVEAGSAVALETEGCFDVQALIPINRITKSTFCLFTAFLNPLAAARLLSTPSCFDLSTWIPGLNGFGIAYPKG
jgi:hypothetical protein